MMDMFTIILIFLLVSFSDSPEKINLGKDLELPKSTTDAAYQRAVKIILTKNELKIDGEILAPVRNQQIVGLTPENLESSSLYKQLKEYRSSTQPKEERKNKAPHVLFLCDKSHSFKTINNVIKTCGLAGYPNFQFGVLEEKSRYP